MRVFLSLTFLAFLAWDANSQTKYSIQSTMAAVRASSLYLKTENFNINIAQGDVVTAKLRPNPVLNNQTLQLVGSNHYPNGTEWNNRLNRQVWWQLTKPFQLPPLRKHKIEYANQNLQLFQQNFGETVRNFSFDAANQWLNTWIIESRLDLLQQAYNNLDSLVKINKARLRNEVISETDLMRTQLLLDQYNLQLINAKKDFKNEIQRLKFFISSNDSIDVDIDSPIEVIIIAENFDSLYTTALEGRNDLRVAKSEIALAESNIKLQKALALPQPELGAIWNPQNSIPYVGFYGTLKIPLLDRNQGEREKSKYIQLQAQANLKNTELQLHTEVQAAFNSYRTEKESLRKFESILKQSQQVLENVRYSYVKGGTTIIDFLDAQRSWFDTRQLYLNQLLEYHQSYIRLLFVTGLINQL